MPSPAILTGDTKYQRCERCSGTGYRSTYPKTGRLKIRVINCDPCNGRGEVPIPHPAYSIEAGILKGKHAEPYTIEANDIGRHLAADFGTVSMGDVGKRCWRKRRAFFEMENAEQRDARKVSP